ncbi:MAG: L,D-transpeptidase [Deltaproteobacteria bacterium]|nr:L,D-transpeptidase [Deltaproteobacteria bacterium]
MKRLWSLSMVMILLALASAAVAAPTAPPLYHQVVGGIECCEYTGKPPITILAVEKGVKATVVIRENRIKGQRIKKGQVLRINTRHIVPMEIDNGFVINLPELLLYHFVNGNYQRRYTIAIGKPSWPTPTGSYIIEDKRTNPTWNVPPSIQEEMEDQGLEVVEKVPPGPKNPLGKFYMQTSASGVGIHATNRPWSVGSFVSHGCMRMLPSEIAKLFPQVKVGTPVKIIYRPIKLAVTPEGRVYLEVHPNIYQWEFNPKEYVQDMAEYYQICDRIDWDKVPAILKAKEGIAQEVTKGPLIPWPVAPPANAGDPKEVRLSPLQAPKATVE